MQEYIKRDLSKSALVFDEIIKPIIIQKLGGTIETIEGVENDSFKAKLDIYAGIDYFHCDKNKHYWGIANRIQYINSDILKNAYKTFTTRDKRESGAKTEYQKRKESIENGSLYPHWTIQSYVNKNNNNDLLGLAIAKTIDIIWMIDEHYSSHHTTGCNEKGQSDFYATEWRRMEEFDKFVDIYLKDN